MGWSWKIGEVRGIGIFVHWTFLILIAWIVGMYAWNGETIAKSLEGVVFVLAIFGCVLLHELGHALTAQRFDVRTRDITLLPIGGVARLERIPEEPFAELLVALAGPAVNVVIAGVLFVGLSLLHGLEAVSTLASIGGGFFSKLFYVNIILVAFNLLPAFPMDGGRVLRALLASRLDYVRATQIASSVGQGMAILFGILGLFAGNFVLLFIALFVFLGAQQEAHATTIRSFLRGVPIREAMITRFRSLSPEDSLSTATSELLAGDQKDFPVLQEGEILGLVTRDDLMAALTRAEDGIRVGDIMRRDVVTVTESEMLDQAFARMQEGTCGTMPVVRGGELVGIVNLENVGEWLMIQSSLRESKARGEIPNVFRPSGTP